MQADIIVEEFQKFNSKIIDQRVVVYGLGEKTELILESCAPANVFALMDRERKNGELWGLPIIDVEEANDKANVIVIIARKGIESIIFHRINKSIKESILIYNISGENLRVKYSAENLKEQICNLAYWDTSMEKLKQEIKQADVISFDIFDTLIGRCIFEPRKLYLFLEEKLAQLIGERKAYEKTRIDVEEKFFLEGKTATLEEINETVFVKLEIEDKWIKDIIQEELELECLFTYKKREVFSCFEYGKALGKQVILVSDMYLQKDKLQKILEHNGIEGYDEIFVSCELHKSKAKGDMFSFLQRVHFPGKSILHIGDHYLDDVESAKKQGVNAFYLMGSKDLMMNSTFAPIGSYVSGINDAVLVGMIMKELFSNPFALCETKGVPVFNSLDRLVGCSYIPLMMRFVSWICTSELFLAEDFFVFCGRDGYIIQKIYEKIRLRDSGIPLSTYFLTSRKAAVVASIRTKEELKDYLNIWYNEYKGTEKTIAEVLAIKLDYSKKTDGFEKKLNSISKSCFEEIVETQKEEILEISYQERQNYIPYIQKVCGETNKKHYIFDYVSQGTIPFALGKVFEEAGIMDTKGLCFMTNNIPNYYYQNVNDIETMCGNYTYYLADRNFEKYHVLGELLFGSQDPMLRKIGENGQAIFEEEVRTKEEIIQLREAQNYVVAFIEEYSKINPEWYKTEFNEKLADFFCGIFTTDVSICEEKVIQQMKINDDYNNKLVDIWKEAVR